MDLKLLRGKILLNLLQHFYFPDTLRACSQALWVSAVYTIRNTVLNPFSEFELLYKIGSVLEYFRASKSAF